MIVTMITAIPSSFIVFELVVERVRFHGSENKGAVFMQEAMLNTHCLLAVVLPFSLNFLLVIAYLSFSKLSALIRRRKLYDPCTKKSRL